MRKLTRTASALFLGAAMLAAAACSGSVMANPTSSSKDAELPAAEMKTVNGLSLKVDPRMELLNIIQYLGEENIHAVMGMVGFEYTDYRLEIDQHFQQYDQHDAIKYYDAIECSDISKAQALMLLMNDDFTVNKEAFDTYMETNSDKTFGTVEKLQELFSQFQAFCKDSGFQEFYDSQRDFYRSIIDETVAVLPKENLIGFMEDFFQEKADGYTVNLVTMQMGNYAGEVRSGGKLYLYFTSGPEWFVNHKPVFGDTAIFSELEAHEFGHEFIPIAGENASPIAEQIKQSEYLYEPVREDMESRAYGKWETVLEETILRACVVHIMENYSADSEKLLQQERDWGFLYIDCVYKSIEKYLANKGAYPAFRDFLPVIMEDLMAEWKE